MKARVIGLGTTMLGIVVGWFFILVPLQEAQAGAARVSYSIKSFVLVPLLIVAGLALLLGGSRIAAAFSGPPRGREQMTITVVVMVTAFAATGLGWWWFSSQMSALGYRH